MEMPVQRGATPPDPGQLDPESVCPTTLRKPKGGIAPRPDTGIRLLPDYAALQFGHQFLIPLAIWQQHRHVSY